MIEIAETLVLAEQINKYLVGKTVKQIKCPSYLHKFTFFVPEVKQFEALLTNKKITAGLAFGIFVEIQFGDTYLAFNDGINITLLDKETGIPEKHQLLIIFDDNTKLVFNTVMYGGVVCHHGDYDQFYYKKSKESISPLDSRFDHKYFAEFCNMMKPTVNMKALLATEQRIPGIGNGTVQDILFNAELNPKRKLSTLSIEEKAKLFNSIKTTIQEMVKCGGRDTEKDMFGRNGGYSAAMNKNALICGCKRCGGKVIKEQFLGGSIYYCPECQEI